MKRAPKIYIVILAVFSLACTGLFAAQNPNDSIGIADLNIKDLSVEENVLGNYFTDAVREALKSDIALLASSEIKTKVAEDSVSLKDISTLVNYPEETITVIEITGKQLLNALEQSIGSYPKPALRYLQVSGMSFVFDPAKPQGSRVVSVMVGKNKLSETKVYSVGVTKSLARGALGYWKIWSKENIAGPENAGTLINAIDSFAKNNALEMHAKDKRIEALSEGKSK